MRVVVISDIHLGTGVSRLSALIDVLKQEQFDLLIINGDLVQDDNWNRLKKEAWVFLGRCRKWTAHKRHKKIAWCQGNHDTAMFHSLGRMVGFDLIGEDRPLELEIGGKKYIFMHGHQFDKWIPENTKWCNFWGTVYDFIQIRLGDKRRHLARKIKLQSKNVLGVCQDVKSRAIAFAASRKADVICCGHVHHAEEFYDESTGVTYLNSGSITEVPAHYIVIDKNGHRLVEF